VELTLCRGPADLTLRIRDRGGGVPFEALPDIWKYAYTTVRDEDEVRIPRFTLSLSHRERASAQACVIRTNMHHACMHVCC
jgi:hypothetical protein